jgi:hypothetical protein
MKEIENLAKIQKHILAGPPSSFQEIPDLGTPDFLRLQAEIEEKDNTMKAAKGLISDLVYIIEKHNAYLWFLKDSFDHAILTEARKFLEQ